MVTPVIKLVAYEDRTPGFVFVAVPDERGRYMRTDKSVVLAPCKLCGATVGEPCYRYTELGKKYSSGTHAWRRSDAKGAYGRFKQAEDLLCQPHHQDAVLLEDEEALKLVEPRPVSPL